MAQSVNIRRRAFPACYTAAMSSDAPTIEVRPMRIRYLRIVFSALCGITCLLMIVLWVRSYLWCDSTTRQRNAQQYRIVSCRGRIRFGWVPDTNGYFVFPCEWESRQIVSPGDFLLRDDMLTVFGYQSGAAPIRSLAARFPATFAVSYWQLATPFTIGFLIAVPWLRWRFSLRTLLIATTLIAVGLGLIVWLNR